jgi:hypothetical protein
MAVAASSRFRIGERITLDNLPAFAAWAIEQATAATETTAAALHVALPQLDLTLYSRDGNYVELVRERLFGAGIAAGRNQPCRIVVTSSGKDGLPAPPRWGEEVFHPRRFENALAGTQFRAEFNHEMQFWQIFDTQRNIGVQWAQSDAAYPSWEPGSPLRSFLHWYYSKRGMRLAHAGTLGKQGKGVLLAGGGGSGKSGTVVGGLLSGLQTVGDDYVLVHSAGGFPKAYPIFRVLKQDPCGLRRLEVLETIAAGRSPNWQGKYEFLCSDLGVEMTTSLEMRAILVPQITRGERSQLSPISQARAMLALAPSGLFQMPGERDSGAVEFARLVRALPCFNLSLGEDHREISRVIEEFLDRLQ